MKKLAQKIEEALTEITLAEDIDTGHGKVWLKGLTEMVENLFTAITFAEAGEPDIARTYIQRGPGKPRCNAGYYYDEDAGMCVFRA